MTCSTTSAISIAFRIFRNRGDYIITESSTYSGTLDCVRTQGLKILSVEMDSYGLCPVDLDRKLRDWDAAMGPKPFVLYTIPSGHNPTSITQTLERRKTIYHVAAQHDLYIIEDDPYYFLQLDNCGSMEPVGTTHMPATDYLSGLLPSYLSLDVSGRVLRMDTTSKILAPGLRCGWVTGCSQVIEKFLAQIDVSISPPSGPSQVMLYKLLDQTWGHRGFIDWLNYLSSQYRRRRDVLVKACNSHLPARVCRWTVPNVGMFLWIRLDLTGHPEMQSGQSPSELQTLRLGIEERIYLKAGENGVIVNRASWFQPGRGQLHEVCFRMTFVSASENDLEGGVERFGLALRTEFSYIG